MRLKLSFLILSIAAVSLGQVWEKPIAPGLVYRMEVDASLPRVVHALRFTPGSPTKAVVELAGKTVYEETPTKGRATVSEMVAQEGALAGLNGDFFPFTGDPLGAMVRGGELLSVPSVARACVGWTNEVGGGAFGTVAFRGSFQANGNEVQIDNLNGECPANAITLNTDVAAFSVAKTPNVHVILRIDDADFSPSGTTTATVQAMRSEEASVPIAKGTAVLVATGNKAGQVSSLRAGDKVVLRFQSSGIDWNKVDQLISGGPLLVKDGAISSNWDAERFRAEFTNSRHPRSAVGRTPAGDFWFVAVDGRQPMSDGATIRELGEVMFKLGCRDAINLDGGGSTALNVLGVNVNRPSDGAERPVANGILFFGPKPFKGTGAVTIEGSPTVDVKASLTLKAMEAGKQIPDADVIWSAQGAAWIDQGGLLRPLKNGSVIVSAWIQGQVVTKRIAVTGTPAPKPRTTPTGSRGGDRTKKKGGG